MNRIEMVREYIDKRINRIDNLNDRRCAYGHLYGVSQICALLALKRNENYELVMIAAMLHDFWTYVTGESSDHAEKGADEARKILNMLGNFSNSEIEMICDAIYHHSNKEYGQCAFNKILIDADLLQHYLYNPMLELSKEKAGRIEILKEECELSH